MGIKTRSIANNLTATLGSETNLQPVKSDLTALALREATNESSAAFNLPNQHIDTFATDTLGTKTQVAITSGYINTITPATDIFTSDADTMLLLSSFEIADGSTTFTDKSSNPHSATVGGNTRWNNTQKLTGTNTSIYFDGAGDTMTFTHSSFQAMETNGDYTVEFWMWKEAGVDFSTDSIFDIGQIQQWEFENSTEKLAVLNTEGGANVIEATACSEGAWHHVAYTRQSGVFRLYINGVQVDSGTPGSPGSGAYTDGVVRIGHHRSDPNRYFKGWMDAIRISNNVRYPDGTSFASSLPAFGASSSNTTGTAIQAANVVGSAKTKVGGTLLYKDQTGTNTLGTDLKVYMSCDGGSNWTEASSYNAITPVYSTGIKQVRLGETTCTSGTDIRYKVEFANQASGTKECQVHGIGINY